MLSKIGQMFFSKKDHKQRYSTRNSKIFLQPKNTKSVGSFILSLRGMGRPNYPILDKRYAPNSRVPCTDLIPFISDRILEGDILSIKQVMREIIKEKPQITDGDYWIDTGVEVVLKMPFEEYVSFKSPHALAELKAFFIVLEKNGSHRVFNITEEIPRLISWACIAHQPTWSPNLQFLADKANSWINEMSETLSYWRQYERIDRTYIPAPVIESNLTTKLLSITPAARIHLSYTLGKGGGSLPDLTNFQIRSLGINVKETSKELINSELVLITSSPENVGSSLSKMDLYKLCDKYGAHYRKYWKREKLAEALAKVDSKLLNKIAKSKNIIKPNYSNYPDLMNLVKIADKHEVGFRMLFFA